MPGTRPRTSSFELFTAKPPSRRGPKVTAALTASRSGAWPACARPPDRAIAKHAACAAASSSSGLAGAHADPRLVPAAERELLRGVVDVAVVHRRAAGGDPVGDLLALRDVFRENARVETVARIVRERDALLGVTDLHDREDGAE